MAVSVSGWGAGCSSRRAVKVSELKGANLSSELASLMVPLKPSFNLEDTLLLNDFSMSFLHSGQSVCLKLLDTYTAR